MGFLDLVKAERRMMNPIRFRMNYVVVPIFFTVTVTCILVGAVLISIDETRYEGAFIGIMVLVGVLMAALLASVPFVRRKEIAIELAKHDYDTSTVEDRDTYEFVFSDGSSVALEYAGVTIFDRFFHYGGFRIAVETSNMLNQVHVFLSFQLKGGCSLAEEEDGSVDGFHLELTKELLHAVDHFPIRIENRSVLDALRSDKQKAFEQIYKTGRIREVRP